MTIKTTATRLPRLMACIGSRLMPPSFPNMDDDRTARDQGDAAHWIAQQVFEGVLSIEELSDRKCPNGVYATPEMIEHVSEYLSALETGTMELDTTWSGAGFTIAGRTDHIAHTGDTLIVDDFKYGYGIVEPDENWTLVSHAIGFCIARNVQPATIILRIHQPRAYHPDGKMRAWSISYAQLLDYHARISTHLFNPSDALNTGPQCTRCHALATCPAARAASYNAIDAADIAYSDTLGAQELFYELDTLRTASATLANRLTALEELAKHRMRSGEVIADADGAHIYATQDQWGHTKWLPGVTPAMVLAMSGVDIAKIGTETPAEAKRRGLPDGVAKLLTERPRTGVKLVRTSADKMAKRLLG